MLINLIDHIHLQVMVITITAITILTIDKILYKSIFLFLKITLI